MALNLALVDELQLQLQLLVDARAVRSRVGSRDAAERRVELPMARHLPKEGAGLVAREGREEAEGRRRSSACACASS